KKIQLEKGIRSFIKERYKLHKSINKKCYIESNPYLCLLIPIIRNVFNNYKVVYIVRDGRDWLRSAISRGIYSSYIHKTQFPLVPLLRFIPIKILFYIQKILKLNLKPLIRDVYRIRAIDFDNDPFRKSWFAMTQFEKLAWKWDKLNTAVFEAIKNDQNVLIIKFEDIFNYDKDFAGFFKILDHFGLKLDNNTVRLKIRELFSKKINKTVNYKIPHWKDWNLKLTKRFNLIANGTMHLYEYY
ncbi:MAG: hypothetical protein ACFFGP_02475, partial [Promethearchaeota archaeon]